MKTIIDPSDLISYYLYSDETLITESDFGFIVGDIENPDLNIHEPDFILLEDVPEPNNFKPAKYKLIENEWVLNPFYLPTE